MRRGGRKSYLQEPPLLSSPPCPLNFPSHFPCHCLFSTNLRNLALVAFLSQSGSLLQQHRQGDRFCRKVPPPSQILQQVECTSPLALLAFLISPNLSSTSSTSSSHLNPHHLDNVALGETTMTTQCAKISILSMEGEEFQIQGYLCQDLSTKY